MRRLTRTWHVASSNRLVCDERVSNETFDSTLDTEQLLSSLLGDVVAKVGSHLGSRIRPCGVQYSGRSILNTTSVHVWKSGTISDTRRECGCAGRRCRGAGDYGHCKSRRCRVHGREGGNDGNSGLGRTWLNEVGALALHGRRCRDTIGNSKRAGR